MEFVTRLASKAVAPRYPLEISGRASWQPGPSAETATTWVQEIALPGVPAEHIIVPSFAHGGAEPGEPFRFDLHAQPDVFHLHPVPAAAAASPRLAANENAAVSCHIDCWHTHRQLDAPRIRLTVTAKTEPADYLLTVSVRELEMSGAIEAVAQNIQIHVPASISQMQAARDIKSRICSPTALAMALSVFDGAPAWLDTVAACYDPLTRAYGAWPLAIQWASRHGIIGAVEVLSNWRDVASILATGTPLVCSIRFAQGKLQGAPLNQTGGHLVMLYGMEDGYALVRDPAAASHDEVDRRYRLDEFGEAWLRRRGAAYIFCKN